MAFNLGKIMKKPMLSVYSAYKVVLIFLRKNYFLKGKPVELSLLLNEMSFVKNHLSLDPAAFSIWLKSVEKVVKDSDYFKKEKRKDPDYYSWRVDENRNDKMKKILSAISTYEAMILFITEFWHSYGDNDSVMILLDEIESRDSDGFPIKKGLWENWLEAIDNVINEDYEFS